MKHLSYILLLALMVMSVPTFAQKSEAGKLVWYTDLMKAQEQSKATKKPIFGFFTGSDWCGWCHKLQDEVFAKEEFVKWAKKNVILLEVDFPKQKPQPMQLVQQNKGLQDAFKVQGYPTVYIFTMKKDKATNNMEIKSLGSLGYPAGAVPGKEEVKFLSEANGILAKKGKA